MTDNDRARVDMIYVIANLLTINELVWTPKTVFAALVVLFRGKADLIMPLLMIINRDDSGISIDKNDSRMLLIMKAMRIGKAIHTYAMVSGNDKLSKMANHPESMIKDLPDKDFISVMKIYHQVATENVLALVDYEVTAGDISDFNDEITAFLGWQADPRTATVQRKSASDELVRLIKEIMDFLTKRLDEAMYLFENDGTSFYADYFNGRNIIQPGGADAQTENGTNPIETDTIINLPFTNLGAGKEVQIKCLTPGTNFEIYCSNAPSVPPTGTPLSINDVISPIYTTTDELGWLPDSPYINIHFPPLPVEIEWEVRVG